MDFDTQRPRPCGKLCRSSLSGGGVCRRAGFSLLELLIVLFIFGVLILAAFPHIDMGMRQSRFIQCESRLQMIKRAKSAYVVDNITSQRRLEPLELDSDPKKALFRMYFMEPFPFKCPAAPLEEETNYEDVYHLYKEAKCPYCDGKSYSDEPVAGGGGTP